MTADARETLAQRVLRDQSNAEAARRSSQQELGRFRLNSPDIQDFTSLTTAARGRRDYEKKQLKTLEAIVAEPFHAMVEVYVSLSKDDATVYEEQLWYVNKNTNVNQVFGSGASRLAVLSWTHPGALVALSSALGEEFDVRHNEMTLRTVRPLATARFDSVLPEISAVYDPGGPLRPRKAAKQKAGLKAVKLHMTADQVKAFISRMGGLMVVTGAPGSGKTTVAFQRIRFLFDQQGERANASKLPRYAPELTRVFLANTNLAEQAKQLLVTQLDIPDYVVEGVDDFVREYLDQAWAYKHNARPRRKQLDRLELAARTAILGLSDHQDLSRLWAQYEKQIAERLATAGEAAWTRTIEVEPTQRDTLTTALASAARKPTKERDPTLSALSMGAVFNKVSKAYSTFRDRLSPRERDDFDNSFQHWLYWVYDPLTALADYFGSRETESAERIRRGTGGRVDEAAILAAAKKDWAERIYSREDTAWLAWLLRFALPTVTEGEDRFKQIPSAIAPARTEGERWTHVAIDEAQDLTVAQASLIGSMVDPDGALTVSADFRQIVSPLQGIRNADAFQVGRSLRGRGTERVYPFARNMRQSHQIGRFLQSFYETVFREKPTFNVNNTLADIKPQVFVEDHQGHARRIKQIVAALRRSDVIETIALLQINEDEHAMTALREELETIEVPLAPIWSASGEGLLTSSVERIKGLEFDACIVLGLENVERSALNFTLNRAYVALSRPARRLALLCTEFPPLLRRMDKSLFDVTQAG